MSYVADKNRYQEMKYNRCGKSGLLLPAITLGLWHNFGDENSLANVKEMLFGAFDMGITHFDLANNYGPSAGSAESNFGEVMRTDLKPYRDELVISTKAGYGMWEGPYGDGGSKKYLISSLDQSLKRMNLDYVDIFYHHRRDPETPMEETVEALKSILDQGKALYVGISNYNAEDTRTMIKLMKEAGGRCLIHQMFYNMLERHNEKVIDVLEQEQVGAIAFSPLAQGRLTNKYFNGIPVDSRAAGTSPFLNKEGITDELLKKTKALNDLAESRGQSLSQMALAWTLRGHVTSVIIGASKLSQIKENVGAIQNLDFTAEELQAIDKILLG